MTIRELILSEERAPVGFEGWLFKAMVDGEVKTLCRHTFDMVFILEQHPDILSCEVIQKFLTKEEIPEAGVPAREIK